MNEFVPGCVVAASKLPLLMIAARVTVAINKTDNAAAARIEVKRRIPRLLKRVDEHKLINERSLKKHCW
jgi:hypothetical protein